MSNSRREKQSVLVQKDGSIFFDGMIYKSYPGDDGHIRLLGKKGKYVWVAVDPEGDALDVWDQLDNVIGRAFLHARHDVCERAEDVELPATDEAGDVVTICVPVTALDRWWSALDAGEKAEIFSSHMSYLDALEAPAETAVRG